MNILESSGVSPTYENSHIIIFTVFLVCAILLRSHRPRQGSDMPPYTQLFGRNRQHRANQSADASPTPSDSPEISQPSPEPFSIRAANRTLYTALSKTSSEHNGTPRPALAPEIILQILSHPSRHICVEAATFLPAEIDPMTRKPANRSEDEELDELFEEVTPPQSSPEVQAAIDRIRAGELAVSENQSPLPIIRTRALTETEVRRVRRVVFEMVSHDQGSSWESHTYGGTFEHSWTWFEAMVRHAAPEPASPASPTSHEGTSDGAVAAAAAAAGEEQQDETAAETEDVKGRKDDGEMQSDPEQRWDIQRNRHGSRKFERHRIEMDADSELVQSLRAGDVLGLDACARFGMWVNHIQSARVEVWCLDDLSGELKEVRGAGGRRVESDNNQGEEAKD